MIAIEEEKIINSIRSLGDQILENSYLVELFVKEMVISFYIKGIEISKNDEKKILKNFLRINNIVNDSSLKKYLKQQNLTTVEKLSSKLVKKAKLEKYYSNKYKSKAKIFFKDNREFFDKVTYCLIRTTEKELAKEIYLQIEAGEKNIYDLASKFSEGDEKYSKGIIGPVAVNKAHPVLKERIISYKLGDYSEPIRIEKWWIIFKLELYIKAIYNKKLELKICRNLFEKFVLEESMSIIGKLGES